MGWVVGLDVGSKTIGVARLELQSGLSRPLKTLARHGVERDIDALLRLLEGREVSEFVIGLPLDEEGAEQRSSRLARQVADALASRTGTVVHLQDESHSTLEAEHRLREAGVRESRWNEVIDSWAAAVILEDWADTQA